MKAIAAASERNEIGVNGNLIKTTSEDFEMFRSYTRNKTVVGGRKTFDEIGYPLRNRENVVLTRDKDYNPGPGYMVCNTKEQVLDRVDRNNTVIIGGGEIYELFANEITELLLTVWKHIPVLEGDITYLGNELLFKMKAVSSVEYDDRYVYKLVNK